MPFYDYECDSCGHTFEELQSIKADPLTDCPECSEPTLRRLFGVPGLVFKGPGFYVNDYPKEQGGD